MFKKHTFQSAVNRLVDQISAIQESNKMEAARARDRDEQILLEERERQDCIAQEEREHKKAMFQLIGNMLNSLGWKQGSSSLRATCRTCCYSFLTSSSIKHTTSNIFHATGSPRKSFLHV